MTQTKYNTIFKDVKDRVSYEDLNHAVGWRSKKKGNRVWINSPFNSGDKNPSLCQYIGGGWKDYSTGEAGGDIVSLYAKAFKVKPIEAAQQLASMFHVPFKEGRLDWEQYRNEEELKRLSKLLTEQVEDFFNAILQRYKVYTELKSLMREVGTEWTDPVYRYIRYAAKFYDCLTENFISGSFEDQVRIMREYANSYFFKLCPGGGGY